MSSIDVKSLSTELEAAIANMRVDSDMRETGLVTRVGDGVAWIYGLTTAGYAEVITIESESGSVEAFVLNLMEDEIGAVLLGEDRGVKAGDKVTLSGSVLRVPTGDALLGRVVDPLGRPLEDAAVVVPVQQPLAPLGERHRAERDDKDSHNAKPPGTIYAREVETVRIPAAKTGQPRKQLPRRIMVCFRFPA